MHKPALLALLAATLAAGCLGGASPDTADTEGDEGDRDGYRGGVVFLARDYTVGSVQPVSFPVDLDAGARDVVLEIQMDSGVMPNLRVELTGCGAVEPRSSGTWQSYPLCEAPSAGGRQRLSITVQGAMVGGNGSGRVLLRADLPDP